MPASNPAELSRPKKTAKVDDAKRPSARGRALILMGYVVIFAIAGCLPALYLEGTGDCWRGVDLMVLGPLGLKRMQFGWMANVFALLALHRVMNRPGVLVMIYTGLAVVLSLDTLLLLGAEVPTVGRSVRVAGLGLGFYLWLLGLLWPFIALMLLRVKPPERVRGDFSG